MKKRINSYEIKRKKYWEYKQKLLSLNGVANHRTKYIFLKYSKILNNNLIYGDIVDYNYYISYRLNKNAINSSYYECFKLILDTFNGEASVYKDYKLNTVHSYNNYHSLLENRHIYLFKSLIVKEFNKLKSKIVSINKQFSIEKYLYDPTEDIKSGYVILSPASRFRNITYEFFLLLEEVIIKKPVYICYYNDKFKKYLNESNYYEDFLYNTYSKHIYKLNNYSKHKEYVPVKHKSKRRLYKELTEGLNEYYENLYYSWE